MKPREFFSEYWAFAEQSEKETKVPALVTMAQAALESGWGEHAPGNNFFGIKCAKAYTGKRQKLRTKECIKGKLVEIYDDFMVYDSPQDSFRDHGLFIARRFPWAMGNINPVQFVEDLQSRRGCRYATDDMYTQKIVSIIQTFKHLLTESVLDGKNKVQES